ncbi:transposase [Nonomuraea sp. 3N208]|uniref:transposase n=1 Tax=Nonomuraea sp. 3N208 TaxID=3457421 RepID=UPI003FD1D68D
MFAFLAEQRQALSPARMFADMYPSANGRPSLPPQVLAAAVVLQTLHGLSDADAVQALRCDLRWKAACGLRCSVAAELTARSWSQSVSRKAQA